MASWFTSSIQSRLVKFLLKRVLGRYLKTELDNDSFDVALSQGTLTLKNLELNCDVLNEMLDGLPFVMTSGFLGRVTIEVPFSDLMGEHCKVTVSKIEVTIVSKSSANLQQNPVGGLNVQAAVEQYARDVAEEFMLNAQDIDDGSFYSDYAESATGTVPSESGGDDDDDLAAGDYDCDAEGNIRRPARTAAAGAGGPQRSQPRARAVNVSGTEEDGSLSLLSGVIDNIIKNIQVSFEDVVVRLEHTFPGDPETGSAPSRAALLITIPSIEYADETPEVWRSDDDLVGDGGGGSGGGGDGGDLNASGNDGRPSAAATADKMVTFANWQLQLAEGLSTELSTGDPLEGSTASSFHMADSYLFAESERGELPTVASAGEGGESFVRLRLATEHAVNLPALDVEVFLHSVLVRLTAAQFTTLTGLLAAFGVDADEAGGGGDGEPVIPAVPPPVSEAGSYYYSSSGVGGVGGGGFGGTTAAATPPPVPRSLDPSDMAHIQSMLHGEGGGGARGSGSVSSSRNSSSSSSNSRRGDGGGGGRGGAGDWAPSYEFYSPDNRYANRYGATAGSGHGGSGGSGGGGGGADSGFGSSFGAGFGASSLADTAPFMSFDDEADNGNGFGAAGGGDYFGGPWSQPAESDEIWAGDPAAHPYGHASSDAYNRDNELRRRLERENAARSGAGGAPGSGADGHRVALRLKVTAVHTKVDLLYLTETEEGVGDAADFEGLSPYAIHTPGFVREHTTGGSGGGGGGGGGNEFSDAHEFPSSPRPGGVSPVSSTGDTEFFSDARSALSGSMAGSFYSAAETPMWFSSVSGFNPPPELGQAEHLRIELARTTIDLQQTEGGTLNANVKVMSAGATELINGEVRDVLLFKPDEAHTPSQLPVIDVRYAAPAPGATSTTTSTSAPGGAPHGSGTGDGGSGGGGLLPSSLGVKLAAAEVVADLCTLDRVTKFFAPPSPSHDSDARGNRTDASNSSGGARFGGGVGTGGIDDDVDSPTVLGEGSGGGSSSGGGGSGLMRTWSSSAGVDARYEELRRRGSRGGSGAHSDAAFAAAAGGYAGDSTGGSGAGIGGGAANAPPTGPLNVRVSCPALGVVLPFPKIANLRERHPETVEFRLMGFVLTTTLEPGGGVSGSGMDGGGGSGGGGCGRGSGARGAGMAADYDDDDDDYGEGFSVVDIAALKIHADSILGFVDVGSFHRAPQAFLNVTPGPIHGSAGQIVSPSISVTLRAEVGGGSSSGGSGGRGGGGSGQRPTFLPFLNEVGGDGSGSGHAYTYSGGGDGASGHDSSDEAAGPDRGGRWEDGGPGGGPSLFSSHFASFEDGERFHINPDDEETVLIRASIVQSAYTVVHVEAPTVAVSLTKFDYDLLLERFLELGDVSAALAPPPEEGVEFGRCRSYETDDDSATDDGMSTADLDSLAATSVATTTLTTIEALASVDRGSAFALMLFVNSAAVELRDSEPEVGRATGPLMAHSLSFGNLCVFQVSQVRGAPVTYVTVHSSEFALASGPQPAATPPGSSALTTADNFGGSGRSAGFYGDSSKASARHGNNSNGTGSGNDNGDAEVILSHVSRGARAAPRSALAVTFLSDTTPDAPLQKAVVVVDIRDTQLHHDGGVDWVGHLSDFFGAPKEWSAIQPIDRSVNTMYTIAGHLTDCSILYNPVHHPSKTVIAIDAARATTNIASGSSTLVVTVSFGGAGIFIVDDVVRLRPEPTSGTARRRAGEQGMVEVAAFDFLRLVVRSCDPEARPSFELELTNHEATLDGCVDSFAAFIDIITYYTSDGDAYGPHHDGVEPHAHSQTGRRESGGAGTRGRLDSDPDDVFYGSADEGEGSGGGSGDGGGGFYGGGGGGFAAGSPLSSPLGTPLGGDVGSSSVVAALEGAMNEVGPLTVPEPTRRVTPVDAASLLPVKDDHFGGGGGGSGSSGGGGSGPRGSSATKGKGAATSRSGASGTAGGGGGGVYDEDGYPSLEAFRVPNGSDGGDLLVFDIVTGTDNDSSGGGGAGRAGGRGRTGSGSSVSSSAQRRGAVGNVAARFRPVTVSRRVVDPARAAAREVVVRSAAEGRVIESAEGRVISHVDAGERLRFLPNHFSKHGSGGGSGANSGHSLGSLAHPTAAADMPASVSSTRLLDLNVVWILRDGLDFGGSRPAGGVSGRAGGGNGASGNSSSSSNSGGGSGGGSVSGGRSTDHMRVEIRGLSFISDSYPTDTVYASRLDFSMRDIEVFDRLAVSTWNKFLCYLETAVRARPRNAAMFRFRLDRVRPSPAEDTQEARVKVRVLPLRLNVDQDAAEFLVSYFGSLAERLADTPAYCPPSTEPPLFIQAAEIYPLSVRFNYKAKRLDFVGLSNFDASQLRNLFNLEDSALTLSRVKVSSVHGFDQLFDRVVAAWGPHIVNTQIPSLVAGLQPLRPVVNIGAGVANLILLPLEQYQRDGRILQGLHKGASAFIHSTAKETVDIGARLATGAQSVLETVDDFISENQRGPPTSLYAAEPAGVKEGLAEALNSLQEGFSSAIETIVAVPVVEYERTGAGGAVRSVVRAVPIAVLRPMIGATGAVSKSLQGVRNAMDPRRVDENRNKYKKGNEGRRA